MKKMEEKKILNDEKKDGKNIERLIKEKEIQEIKVMKEKHINRSKMEIKKFVTNMKIKKRVKTTKMRHGRIG